MLFSFSFHIIVNTLRKYNYKRNIACKNKIIQNMLRVVAFFLKTLIRHNFYIYSAIWIFVRLYKSLDVTFGMRVKCLYILCFKLNSNHPTKKNSIKKGLFNS